MNRLLLIATILLAPCALSAAEEPAGPKLPVAVDGFILGAVDEALGKQIGTAQEGKGPAFTIAVDGAKAEALAISDARIRDIQNVYYRITGQAGAWRLEERIFSATGEDDESKLIRRALGVPEDRKVFFLPGREHLLAPAKQSVILRSPKGQWEYKVAPAGAGAQAVNVRAGQAVTLTLTDALNSGSAKAGTAVALAVRDDVVADGRVAIAKGTLVTATVKSAAGPGGFGTPARLCIQVASVKAVDGTEVPLCGKQGPCLSFTGGAGFLFFRGANVKLPAGASLATMVKDRCVVLVP